MFYVGNCRNPALKPALEEVREAYAGEEGFLGRHRRKVFGYLEIAFKVGRGVTIGGFAGQPADRSWETVDDALESSRAERDAGPQSSQTERAEEVSTRESQDRRAHQQTSIPVSELSQHHDPGQGWWIAVHGRVHDVTGLLRRHPGGHHILCAYAGLDASQPFRRAHSGRLAVERLRRSVEIGTLWHPPLSEKPRPGSRHSPRALYRAWVQALYQAVEMRNTLGLDRSFIAGTTLDEAVGRPATRYELERATHTLVRYQSSYLHRLTTEVLVPLTLLMSHAGVPATSLNVNTQASLVEEVESRPVLRSTDVATALRSALNRLGQPIADC